MEEERSPIVEQSSMYSGTVMIVEDEKEIAELLKDYLEEEQFRVIVINDGASAVKLFKEKQPDVIILDVLLPNLNGLEVCRMIRSESTVPIILLSAKKSDTDKIIGLGLGADDYVGKPFSPKEVVARVKAQIRRLNQLSFSTKNLDIIKYNEFEINTKAYEVKVRNQNIRCSAKEFEVLRFFAFHPNQVFTREQIFNHVWGFHEHGDMNTVTVHIKKLREKIEKEPSNPQYLKTVWGVGYKFDGGVN